MRSSSRGRLWSRVGPVPGAAFNSEGDLHAVDNRCPYMGFPLHRGTIEDGIPTWHRHRAFEPGRAGRRDGASGDRPFLPRRRTRHRFHQQGIRVARPHRLVALGRSPALTDSPAERGAAQRRAEQPASPVDLETLLRVTIDSLNRLLEEGRGGEWKRDSGFTEELLWDDSHGIVAAQKNALRQGAHSG